MKLFKYKGIELNDKEYPKTFLRDINCFLNNKIWFSKIEHLNDPFEGGYKVNFLQNKLLEKSLGETVVNDLIVSREKLLKTKKDTLGILSLTTDNKNLLMWSHYTNNHKGYCLEFDLNIHDFKFNPFNEFDLRKVNYNNVPHLDNILDKDYLKNITIKSKDWIYEKEYRFISTIYGELNYSENCLKSIFIGANCSSENEIMLYMLAYHKKCKLYKAKFYNGSFDLYFQELDLNNISKNINFDNLLNIFKTLL